MKIAIATDHNGKTLKIEIIKFLESKGYEVLDKSPSNYAVDDYPDFAFLVGEAIQNKEADVGILMCGSGIGMSIAANKMDGVYAALVTNLNDAALSKEHNNANVITLSSKATLNDTIKMIDIFLNTKFSDEPRHLRRFNKIKDYRG